jgi:hypothetical protein
MRHAFARTSAAMRKCFGSKSGRFISGVSRIAALAGRRTQCGPGLEPRRAFQCGLARYSLDKPLMRLRIRRRKGIGAPCLDRCPMEAARANVQFLW